MRSDDQNIPFPVVAGDPVPAGDADPGSAGVPGRTGGQLLLFPGGGSAWQGGRPRRGGRNRRMAQHLDAIAAQAERQAAAARRAGDRIEAHRATERAHDARRAAALLRAGPEGVGRLLAS